MAGAVVVVDRSQSYAVAVASVVVVVVAVEFVESVVELEAPVSLVDAVSLDVVSGTSDEVAGSGVFGSTAGRDGADTSM